MTPPPAPESRDDPPGDHHRPDQPPPWQSAYGGVPYGDGQQARPQPVDPTLALWWQRLLARLIDGLIMSVVTVPIAVALLWDPVRDLFRSYDPNAAQPIPPAEMLHFQLRVQHLSLIAGLISVIFSFLYEVPLLARWGQTVGKRVLKIKVVTLADRGPLSGTVAAKRVGVLALPPLVPYVGSMFALINELFLLWDRPHRQCLHDKFAKTIVVRLVPPPVWAPTP